MWQITEEMVEIETPEKIGTNHGHGLTRLLDTH
jgi:hypothetical protein